MKRFFAFTRSMTRKEFIDSFGPALVGYLCVTGFMIVSHWLFKWNLPHIEDYVIFLVFFTSYGFLDIYYSRRKAAKAQLQNIDEDA